MVPSPPGDLGGSSLAHSPTGITSTKERIEKRSRDNSSAVWPVSGKDTEAADFLQRLQNFCFPYGGHNPHSHTSLSLVIGPAGIQSGIVISFQVLLADVANFLAHLHEEAYQSCPLNGYRSAISSVHATVNGVEVGKQPIPLGF